MKNRSALLGLGMVLLGIAVLGYAAVQVGAAIHSSTAVVPTSLSINVSPSPTPSAPPAETARTMARETLAPPPPSPNPSPAPSEETSNPAPIAALPEETSTLAPIATLPAAPLAPPAGSMSRAVRIVIPVLHLDARVVEMPDTVVMENGEQVSDWQVPKYEVGHAVGSANPGERDNVVMSAHNNLYTALFRKLYTMKPGDEITLYNAAGAAFLYRVFQSYIVQEVGVSFEQQVANAQVMLPTQDARLTLISCYPENNNTHRAIVIAQLLDLPN
jgi:sortase A